MSYITLSHIQKTFGRTDVIKDINIQIEKGEFVCFVGPSGCGKSTLLRIIAGLERQDQGSISIDHQDISLLPPAKRGIAMVFQTYALYPHLNVYNNMALALKQEKKTKQEIEERIKVASKMLQLDSLLTRYPSELSGGQRQRVAIARSIVRHPKVFLLDEPLSNLDAALRVEVRLKLAQLHKTLQSTMMYVTHDQVEAMTLADKVVILNQGRIEQVGSPMDVYFNPANTFVATFIGTPKMNILPCTYTDPHIIISQDFMLNQTLPLKSKLNQDIQIGVRPEHWHIDENTHHGITAQVLISERLGSETFVYLETPHKQLITVKLPGKAFYPPQTTVKVYPAPEHVLFFDKQGQRIV